MGKGERRRGERGERGERLTRGLLGHLAAVGTQQALSLAQARQRGRDVGAARTRLVAVTQQRLLLRPMHIVQPARKAGEGSSGGVRTRPARRAVRAGGQAGAHKRMYE